jgi:uncharacterized membrane protein (DUF2068 family)
MNSVPIPASRHGEAHRARLQALRSVSLLEFAKGVVVLAAVVALHWFDPNDVADAFLNFLHISPDRHLARFLLNMADKLSDVKFWHLAVGASCYSGLRFAEAIGLWRAKAWAEWIALISGALYVPIEIRVLWRHTTIFHAGVLVVNLAIVAFMFYLRIYVPQHEKRHAADGDSSKIS